MQSKGNLGGAAKLDESSDSDQDRDCPNQRSDSSETARQVPPNMWASVDLAEYGGGTLYGGTASHAYCVYIKLSADDVRTLVNVVRFLGRELASRPVKERSSTQLVVIGFIGRARVIPSRCTLS